VVDFLKDKKGKILDLGCGSGRNFLAMPKEVEIFGVDFSKEMLKLAGKNVEKLGLNVRLKESGASKISFEDNFFDSAICIAVLHCLSEKAERQGAIKELYRTLKPGCKAFISVWGKNSPRLKNKGKECFVGWNVKSSKKFREGEQGKKEERYTYIYDLEELKKEVLDAGFEIESIWEERNVNVICKKN
jgi:ubiquinone/menaquinone biosynthesis C-methylase UbiE